MFRPALKSVVGSKYILGYALLVAVLVVVLFSIPSGASAIAVVIVFGGICLFAFRSFTEDKDFVTRLFLFALAVRMGFGIMVHIFDLRDFFGGDALTYDNRGSILLDTWFGQANATAREIFISTSTSGPGWGMNYLVASLYLLFGKNILAAQSFCAVVGAGTVPMVYYCANQIYDNKRVARYAAIAAAFFPAMIIWSSQLLKDGLIIFLLVLAMTMVLQLQKKLNIFAIVLLAFSLFGILSLRFYIFYMVVIAVVGSFVVGVSGSNKSVFGRVVVLTILGLSLTYFGVINIASTDLDRYGDLQRVQNSRLDLTQRAASGFGSGEDVSTATGAIAAIPIGLAYLMLAPFPWQAANLRQAITIPETILWWAMIPVILYGSWFTIIYRLRNALPVLIFSLMLTFAYSIFQGNVGTAYRQRTQIQVFLFIFCAVGLVVRSEKRRDRADFAAAQRDRVNAQLRANAERRI